MAQLFISHAEEDKAGAIEIGDALERRGFSVWLYERDCVPGPPYLMQVSEAIAQCEGVILVISLASMASHQVDAEVAVAFDAGKRFVPVLSGVSYADFRTRKPDWSLALRAATSVTLPPDGPSTILDQIENGVRRLGVNPTAPPARDEHEARKKDGETSAAPPNRLRKAYLCYAGADREEVLKRAQALSMADISIMYDSGLNPSPHRPETVFRMIDEADVFYLFWSEAAARSEWVSREIDYALQRQNGDYDNPPRIIPVVLSQPSPPPPTKLAWLHFDNRWSYLFKTQQSSEKKGPPHKKSSRKK